MDKQGRKAESARGTRGRGRAGLMAAVGALTICAGAAAAPAGPPSDQAVKARADALISQMTPEEKAAQLSNYFYFDWLGAQLNKEPIDRLSTTGLGAVLFVSDPAQANKMQRLAMEKSRLKIPLMFGFDVIHGLRTVFPVPLGLAASWDPALVEATQAVAAKEARASGIQWTFAPMLDITRDARWGRISEGGGEDPFLGAALARAHVRGFQGDYIGAPGRIIAGPKHFVGYGAAMGGRDYDEVNLPEAQLWNVYLPPFKAAVDAGAGNIMSAYMQLNDVPASGNGWLLNTVLRDTWGFKGFVVSDANAVNSLVTQGYAADRAEAAKRALKAGLDMEMIPILRGSSMVKLPELLKSGEVTSAEVDTAVRRILEAKIRMGLFEHPYVDEAAAEAVLNDPTSLKLARVAAERSAVLLKNDGGVLPLDRKQLKSVAVVGPLADSARDILGPSVASQTKPKTESLLTALRAKLGAGVKVDYVQGVQLPGPLYPQPTAEPRQKPAPLDETADIARAAQAAKAADVTIVVLGEPVELNYEETSTTSLDLPGRQQDLLDAVLATGKPVVVVLMTARPLKMQDTAAPAILQLWYPGSAGGEAGANLLLGEANPGGKLPMTWIRDAAQAPFTYAHLRSHEPDKAYKRYWNVSGAPTWPFGYGLSYTRFEYANLRVERPTYKIGETVQVSVDLKNVGSRAGDEVAQLYLHQRSGQTTRPDRELKGFTRVSLKPGETRTLTFKVPAEDLRYWSSQTRGWVQDAAAFDVWVGGDSEAKLKSGFAVGAF